MTIPRVCVIGAGPAGMSMLIQLKFREQEASLEEGSRSLEEGSGRLDVVAFESQPTWGGVWNYNWRTGLAIAAHERGKGQGGGRGGSILFCSSSL
jgi:trimethylamine monooxygenase